MTQETDDAIFFDDYATCEKELGREVEDVCTAVRELEKVLDAYALDKEADIREVIRAILMERYRELDWLKGEVEAMPAELTGPLLEKIRGARHLVTITDWQTNFVGRRLPTA
ncbi:MAG: hypothetical protein Q4F72_09365 [Desulfovibrionaceae bacterium]|nr:hypothetical protein [Desulfovibrionaceae bacterium]